jgi:pimeloyl-ACP methyl ester carboxylesterase
VVCPTALLPQWHTPENLPFLEAVLDEVALLYNVDLNRVYLAGHSMGGYGAWYLGPEWAERWAAFGTAAGGGGPAAGRLRDTQTAVHVYHGADDMTVRVDGDRAAAKALLKNGNDFIYTELNGVGHSWPDEVRVEMADYFETKRLARGKGRRFTRDDSVRSSWLERLAPSLLKEEIHFLGDPRLPEGGGGNRRGPDAEDERKRLLAMLDLGGGGAEEAAKALGASGDADAVKPLVKRLASAGRVADDVRAAAATALGGLGSVEALPALHAGLEETEDRVFLACLDAVARIGDPSSAKPVLQSLGFQAKQFDAWNRGGEMGYRNYESRCEASARAAEAAAAIAEPPSAVAAVSVHVVQHILESKVNVREAEHIGFVPSVVKARLARRVAAALGATKHPNARPVIERIRAAVPGDGGVADACDAALALLDA